MIRSSISYLQAAALGLLALAVTLRAEAPAELQAKPGEGLYQVEMINGAPFHWAQRMVKFEATVPAAGRYWLQVGLNAPFKEEPWPVELQVDGKTVGRLTVTTGNPQKPQFFVVGLDLTAGAHQLVFKTAGPDVKFGANDPRVVALGLTLPVRLVAEPGAAR